MSGNVSGGATAYIGSFALRPPGKDQKPVSQKRKAAFAAEPPKKQPPKLQFSTANVAKKPGAEPTAETGTSQPTSSHDGKLQQWLREGNGDRPGCEEAREYLLRGAPYRGTSLYDSKDAIKELGAKWIVNPLKIDKDARDGISRGWWSATSERDLIELIRMPMVKKSGGRSFDYRSKQLDVRQWTAIDVPEASHETVVLLILEHEAYEKEKLELESRAATKARDAKQAAQINSQRRHDAPLDSEKEIARMKDVWGVEWNDDMSMAASRCSALGPYSGVSSIGRAIRGLHLKVCTVEEVTTGEYASNVSMRSIAKESMVAGAPGSSTDGGFVDYTKLSVTGPSSGCLFFGKGVGMRSLPTDREWEQIVERADQREKSRIKTCVDDGRHVAEYRDTWCTSCVGTVVQQFNDCSCLDENRVWQWCSTCYCAWTDGQPCRCSNACEWDDQQQKVRNEAERRAEKADRDAQLSMAIGGGGDGSGSGGSGGSGGGWGNGDDRGDEAGDGAEPTDTLDAYWGL